MFAIDPGELTGLLARQRLVTGGPEEITQRVLMEPMRRGEMQAADGVDQEGRSDARHRQMGRVLLARLRGQEDTEVVRDRMRRVQSPPCAPCPRPISHDAPPR